MVLFGVLATVYAGLLADRVAVLSQADIPKDMTWSMDWLESHLLRAFPVLRVLPAEAV